MKGVVAAGDRHTAEVGAALLRAGGNAVDAAIGATCAAFVAEPILTAPFGGGFATVGDATGTTVWDLFANVPGRGLGPARAQPGLDFLPVDVDFGATTQRFHVGRGATAASAFLRGLVALHTARGRLALREVVAPAVALARAGVTISEGTAKFVAVLTPILTLTPGAAEVFAPTGRVLQAGDRFTNVRLARLLKRLGDGDVEGPLADFAAASAPPAGRLTAEDLAAAIPAQRQPLQVELAGAVVELNGPPSTGGLLVAFGLRLLAAAPASAWRDELATRQHLLAAIACTNAARAELLREGLLGASAAAASTLGERFLSDACVARWVTRFAEAARAGPRGLGAAVPELGGTTHISIVDAAGLACAITSSNGEGCGHVVGDFGVMANNFMGEEDLHPNGFFAQPPGTRLASMMCPTLVRRAGRIALALGTGGANRIRTALLQVLAFRLLCGWDLAQAVGAPRLHYEGEALFIEAAGPAGPMPSDVLSALTRLVPGAVIFPEHNMFFGGVHAAAPDGGVGDARRSGVVIHVE